MTVEEAESLIDEIDRAFTIGLVKVLLIVLLGAFVLIFLDNFLEKGWEDFKYWLDCKKWDWEHRRSK